MDLELVIAPLPCVVQAPTPVRRTVTAESGRFGCIVADPPWRFEFYGKLGNRRSPDHHYPTLTLDDLKALPVAEIAAQDSVLLLWCTWPKLPEGLALMEAWGFGYRTGFPWLKLTRQDVPRIGTGYHVRACSEFVLIGTRGQPKAPEPSERQPGVLFSEQGRHSEKPWAIYDYAELYDGPHLELFHRPTGGMLGPRDHWTFVGNEVDGLDVRDALERLERNG